MPKIRKMDKTKPMFGLYKIPDKELLRYSRVEVGQLKSYIEELEWEISQKDKEIMKLKKELSQRFNREEDGGSL